MPNQKNIDLVKIISEKLARAKAVISIEYHKLDANKINDLRSRLASEGSEVSVVKNTLLKIALKEKKAGEGLIKHLDGPNATIFAFGDAISPIKALYAFVKQFELPKVKAGIIGDDFVAAEQLEILSTLPSRQQLLAQVVRGMKSPIFGLANVLSGPGRKLVYTLSAIASKK